MRNTSASLISFSAVTDATCNWSVWSKLFFFFFGIVLWVLYCRLVLEWCWAAFTFTFFMGISVDRVFTAANLRCKIVCCPFLLIRSMVGLFPVNLWWMCWSRVWVSDNELIFIRVSDQDIKFTPLLLLLFLRVSHLLMMVKSCARLCSTEFCILLFCCYSENKLARFLFLDWPLISQKNMPS